MNESGLKITQEDMVVESSSELSGILREEKRREEKQSEEKRREEKTKNRKAKKSRNIIPNLKTKRHGKLGL